MARPQKKPAPPRIHKLIVFVIVLCGLGAGLLTYSQIVPSSPQPKTSILHRLTRRATPLPTPSDFCINVPVLTYHHIQPFEDANPKNQRALTVTPENFAWHLRTLKEKGYHFISLEELVQALQTRTPFPADQKPLAITLDDGYRDAYTYAYPIAQKYDIPLNIAVITGLVGNPEHLTASQITRMDASGLIHFQNHSWSHMNLKSASHTAIDQQVAKGQEQLNTWLHTPTHIIVYPYGFSGPYVQSILAQNDIDAGFELSLTLKSTLQCLSQIQHLPRIRIGNAGPRVYGL